MSDVIDLVEDEDAPLRVGLEALPDGLEHAVQARVGPLLLAAESEQDLVGRAEDRPTLLQVDVLHTEVRAACGELPTESPSSDRLSRPRRPVHRDRRREIALSNTGEDRCQRPLLVGPRDDFVGLGQRIERALVGEHRLVHRQIVEEVVIA